MLIIAQEFPRVKKPTFNLPDLNDRLPRMASNHTLGGKNSGWVPNISGWIYSIYHKTSQITDGTLFTQYEGQQAGIAGGGFLSNYQIWFDASRVWGGYSSGTQNVMAQNLTMYYIIKY